MNKSKTTNVFFDTEFTSINLNETAQLISIGAVTLDGLEVYFELLDTWTTKQCSAFVLGSVLELLDNDIYYKEADVAKTLSKWITGLGESVVMRSDAPNLDWKFVEDMFTKYDCWPVNLRRTCGVIGFEDSSQLHKWNVGLFEFWKSNEARRHHALVDARSLAFAWKFAVNKKVVTVVAAPVVSECDHDWERDGQTMTAIRWTCTKCLKTKLQK